jgi:PBSX family phage portal protein
MLELVLRYKQKITIPENRFMKVRDRDNPYSQPAQVYRTRRSLLRSSVPFGKKEVEETDDMMKALRAYESQQIQDPFSKHYASGVSVAGPEHILPPPYSPYALMRFPNENNTLRQCIDAMVVNIESMGHRLEYVGPEGADETSEALMEKARIEALLDQPNGEYSLIELRERRRRDIETYGYTFLEVCRGTYTGEIVSYYHVPAHTMRLSAVDATPTEVTLWINRDGKFIKQKVQRRFRRYIQEIGTRRVYFKEFGDPRSISARTGKVISKGSSDEEATEIKFDNLYSPGSPYGMPRWINQLPAVMGSRESELTNLQFFKDNAIPAMAVLVSGGQLTDESIGEIEEHINAVTGRKSIHRVMVLEAEGLEKATAADKSVPAPRLELKPLIHDRQNDALFQEYDKNNQAKVRSSFRLPPIFVGRSEDLTYATAQASLVMAEGQVFGPERNKVDDLFNYTLLADKEGRPPIFWWFRSNPPRIVDPATIVEALGTFDTVGALTPNIAIGIANELFDLNIPLVSEDWGDYPFLMVRTLLEKGELKGIEALRVAVDEVDTATQDQTVDANGNDLPEETADAVQSKIVEPLKQIVSASNVQKLRCKKPKR